MNDYPHDLEIGEFIRIEREEFLSDIMSFSKNAGLEVKPCGDMLYPTHPSQYLKVYHFSRTKAGNYEGHAALSLRVGRGPDGRSEYCLDDLSKSRRHQADILSSRNPKYILPCPKVNDIYMILMSSTYFDDCGDIFRGYWLEEYFAADDIVSAGGVGTAKGRTVFPMPGQEYVGGAVETYDGSTYALRKKDFSFFGPLLPNDHQWIEKEVMKSTGGPSPTHHRSGNLFIRN